MDVSGLDYEAHKRLLLYAALGILASDSMVKACIEQMFEIRMTKNFLRTSTTAFTLYRNAACWAWGQRGRTISGMDSRTNHFVKELDTLMTRSVASLPMKPPPVCSEDNKLYTAQAFSSAPATAPIASLTLHQ